MEELLAPVAFMTELSPQTQAQLTGSPAHVRGDANGEAEPELSWEELVRRNAEMQAEYDRLQKQLDEDKAAQAQFKAMLKTENREVEELRKKLNGLRGSPTTGATAGRSVEEIMATWQESHPWRY